MCTQLSTQNMKHIINCSCARYLDISTITHSAKYRLIIVSEKIQKNIEISIFFQYRTPLVARKKHLYKVPYIKYLAHFKLMHY